MKTDGGEGFLGERERRAWGGEGGLSCESEELEKRDFTRDGVVLTTATPSEEGIAIKSRSGQPESASSLLLPIPYFFPPTSPKAHPGESQRPQFLQTRG